jgi:salicylate hydroxylase
MRGITGLKSRVRKVVLEGKDVEIRFSSSCVYRTLIPAAAMRENSALQSLLDEPVAMYWVGPKAHVIGYPISNGDVYNFVLCDSSTPPVGLISKVVPLAELQSRFRDWEPTVRQLIDLVPEALKWQLSEIEEQPTWVSKSGKVVVIGDASHAMVPHLAQGAAMALEDAAAMAACVEQASDLRDLPTAMARFQEIRRARCYHIQREASELGETWHLSDGPAQQGRDEKMHHGGRANWVSGVESDNPNRWDDPQFQPWLFAYDAYAEVSPVMLVNVPDRTKC